MLDALVAEARLRWGFDPAVGLQVVAAEALIASPIEPSRPLLIVPAGDLARERSASGPAPLPGRAGPGGDDPLALLRRLYPGRPSGRAASGSPTARRSATLDAGDRSTARSTSRRSRRSSPLAGPWAMPWISRPPAPARRLPVGSRADPHLAAQAPARGDLRGLRRARGRGHAGARRGARRPVAADRPARAAGRRGGRLRPDRRPGRDRVARSSAATRTCSATRWRGPPSDVNRQWERIKADERAAAAGSAEDGRTAGRALGPARARSTGSARRCRRSPPARRCRSGPPTSATTGRSIEGVLDKVAEEADELRRAADRRRACRGVRRPAVRARQRRPAGAGSRPRPPSAPRTPSSSAGSRASSAAAAAQGVALRDLDFAALDALWDAAKAEERTRMTIGNRPPTVRADGRGPSDLRPVTLHPRRPEVGRGLVPDQGRRHRGPVRGDDRRPRPAAPARQGHRLGDRRVLDAAARHRRADGSRVGQGPDRRPDARDPAPHRALAARRGRPRQARRADDHGRLRRAPGRRRHAHRLDHRRLRRARRGAHHLRHGAPPRRPRSRRSRSASSTGLPYLDLDYSEDSRADVDFNVVGTDAGTYVELQGTAEGKPFDRARRERPARPRRRRPGAAVRGPGRGPRHRPAVTAPAPPRRHALGPQAARAARAARARPGRARLARRPRHRGRPGRGRRDVRDERRDQGALRAARERPADAGRRFGPRGRRARRRARASGPDATPARTPRTRDNNAKLLAALAGLPPERRGARYVCVLALALPGDAGPRGGVRPSAWPAAPAAAGSRPRRAGRAASATTRSSSPPPSRPAAGRSACGRRPRRTRSRTGPGPPAG